VNSENSSPFSEGARVSQRESGSRLTANILGIVGAVHPPERAIRRPGSSARWRPCRQRRRFEITAARPELSPANPGNCKRVRLSREIHACFESLLRRCDRYAAAESPRKIGR
jgi:hypothetical protein